MQRRAVCIFFLFALSSIGLAQKNEFSLSVGALATSDEHRTIIGIVACPVNVPNCNGPINITTSTTVALEGDYARQIFSFRIVSVAAEFPIVGVPSRDVTASQAGFPPVTASLASLFFTPSARIKLLPSGGISPFFSIGGGLAHYDSGMSQNRGALQFGGGVDFKTPLPHIGLRGEVRDFWAGGPTESTNFFIESPGHKHNVFAGAGVVFKF